MIETGRTIELRHDRRQLDANAPFIAAAAGLRKNAAPLVPPRGGRSCERLDDQHRIAARRALDQALQERLARSVVQLIQRERREYQPRRFREQRALNVVLADPGREAERAIRWCRFAEDLPMKIDADDLRAPAACVGPCGTRSAGAASKIGQRPRSNRRIGQPANDRADQ